jgi:hypothetical protein
MMLEVRNPVRPVGRPSAGEALILQKHYIWKGARQQDLAQVNSDELLEMRTGGPMMPAPSGV